MVSGWLTAVWRGDYMELGYDEDIVAAERERDVVRLVDYYWVNRGLEDGLVIPKGRLAEEMAGKTLVWSCGAVCWAGAANKNKEETKQWTRM